MNTAPSRTHIKRRVEDYLLREKSLPLERLRQTLAEWFLPLGRVAVLGGLVRDIARRGPAGFKSDVDLVIAAAPTRVAKLAGELNAKQNRFGGFSLMTPHWKIDFWALRNTWAHKQGHVHILQMPDIIRCTFFTYDAIAYDISEREIYAHQDYVSDLLSRRLEINLLPNPSIEGNLVRAVRRLLAYDLRPGPVLSNFLDAHLTASAFTHVVLKESELYGNSYAAAYRDSDTLKKALLFSNARERGTARDQLSLPF